MIFLDSPNYLLDKGLNNEEVRSHLRLSKLKQRKKPRKTRKC